MKYEKMRKKRKMMIVDGKNEFKGGMNIREGFVRDIEGDEVELDKNLKIEGNEIEEILNIE